MAVTNTYKGSWGDLLEAVKNYYGSGSDQWVKVATQEATPKELASILKQVPNVETVVNKNGEILSWNLEMPIYNKASSTITNIGEYADSNLVPSTQGSSSLTTIKVPSQTGTIIDGEFKEIPMTSNLVKYKTGQLAPSGSFSTIAGSLSAALTAVSVGIQLGVTIDSLLYKANPDFWEEHGMASLNPETWANITADDDSINASIFNALLGIDNESKEASMYIDERAIAYMSKYLVDSGLLDETSVSKKTVIEGITIPQGIPIKTINMTTADKLHIGSVIGYGLYKGETVYIAPYGNTTDIVDQVMCVVQIDGSIYVITSSSDYTSSARAKGLLAFKATETGYSVLGSVSAGISKYTYNNNTVGYAVFTNPFIEQYGAVYTPTDISYDSNYLKYIAWCMVYEVAASLIEGVSKQEDATIPSLTKDLTIDEWLTTLKELYANLWNERIENTVLQDDGTTQTTTYIPIPMPTGGTGTQITTEGAVQNGNIIDASLDDESDTDEKIATILQILTGETPSGVTNKVTPTETHNPTDTGGGDTPTIIPSTGTASALWSIYNPTLEQVKSLGSYLWSTNFIDSLLKMFNNPMEAVISLHKIFGTPPISGTGNIKIGYLDTGVSDVNLVSEQYFTVDCGSIDLPEYFGSLLDYGGYTNISLYLPFIGIVNIDNADIMRSTITIKYQIDVFTGACLAQINVLRDASGGVLYQYSGNCAVQYPLSMGSYMNVFTSTLQGAIFGGLGGGVGLAVGGALGALRSGGATYERSGNFSGNAGAMGIKKPYLIISRPQTQIADKFNELQGYPTNTYTLMSNCKGFTKVTACHVDFIGNATQTEKTLIDRALKDGIIIN